MHVTIILATCIFIGIRHCDGCGRGRRNRPTPDTTKPEITCPPDISVLADDRKTYSTGVWWTEPVANDNRDGRITPKRRGLGPGKVFYEGSSLISYSARDSSGNYASCFFNIRVKVIRCSQWSAQTNGWRTCDPSHDMMKGTTCSFGCYEGFELQGPDSVTCLATGKWSEQKQPYCKPKTCVTLFEENEHTVITCTDANNYRSTCYYSCKNGFNILLGRKRALVCSAGGTWNGMSPKCVDVSPPVFTDCPSIILGYAEHSKSTGRVMWNVPKITDNDGVSGLVVRQISGPQSGEKLEVGEHEITYLALDRENNTAKCSFPVVLKQIRCRTLYPHPYTYISCPHGHGYGQTCTFSCQNGTALDSQSVVHCESYQTNAGSARYGRWSFGENQPKCKLIETCTKPEPPNDGALVCDIWAGGRYCQIQCRQGYLIKEDIDSLMICLDSKGTWDQLDKNDGKLPDCNKASRIDLILNLKLEEYFYFDGDCESSLQEIKLNYLQAILSRFGNICPKSGCKVDDVEVICGVSNGKTKRDVSSNMNINTIINIIKAAEQDDTFFFNIRSQIYQQLNNDNYILTTSNGSAVQQGLDMSHLVPECMEGSYADELSLTCVECSPGSYHDIINNTCRKCPRGTYQPESGKTSCIQCQVHSTTEEEGAESSINCVDACVPGYFSFNGRPPCSPCNVGTYTDGYGTVECTSCPGSMTTNPALKETTSVKDCYDFDIKYTNADEPVQAAKVVSAYEDQIKALHIAMWLYCESCDNIFKLRDTNGKIVLDVTHYDSLNVGLEGCTINTLLDLRSSTGHWHSVMIYLNMAATRIVVDGQAFTTNQSCPVAVINFTSFEVTLGGNGYFGRITQVNMWTDSVEMSYDSAKCFSNPPGDVLSWRQFAEADGTFILTRSECDDYDNCLSDPCNSHGQCSDSIDSFTCTCSDGFTGVMCETNIDDCIEHSCENQANCQDLDNSYTCLCPDGFSGTFCEIRVVDGSWSAWESWGPCSVTCDSGSHTRVRVCNNPSPDNGGRDCTGTDNETEQCTMPDVCIYECDKLPTNLEHGQLNCSWTGESRMCTPYCDIGYAFDSDMFISDIACGPYTGYTWNIRNDENPDAQLPSCTEIVFAERNVLEYTAEYSDLTFDIVSSSKDSVKTLIQKTIKDSIAEFPCMKTSKCVLEQLEIILDHKAARRKRRESSLVGFKLQISCNPSHDLMECYDLLVGVKEAIDALINTTTKLSVSVGGVRYDILANGTSVDGRSDCSPGDVPVNYFCVQCGPGSYQYTSYCERCPVGEYQDTSRSTACKRCPEGWTTSGLQTRTVSGCSVPFAAPLDTNNHLKIVLPVVLVTVAVCVVAAVIVIFKVFKRRSTTRTNKVNSFKSQYLYENDILNRKPTRSHIEVRSLSEDTNNSLSGDTKNSLSEDTKNSLSGDTKTPCYMTANVKKTNSFTFDDFRFPSPVD